MALEGNIAEFSLPEILQFISSQRKTGVLKLDVGEETAALDFEEGQITGGYYQRQGRQEDLAGYLLKTGLLTEERFTRAEEEQARRSVPMEEVLIEGGYITREDFEELIRFKIQEMMDEIFTWVDGHYTFDLKVRLYTKSKYPILLSTDSFLLEGMRRLDEWMRIKKVLPELDVVLQRAPRPAPEEMTPEQLKFLEFLGPRRLSLDKVVETCGLGKFTTCQVATELLELGVVERYAAEPALPETTVFKVSIIEQVSAISLMVRHLGAIVNQLSLVPFNHPTIMSTMEEFFCLFDGLSLEERELSLVHRLEGLAINRQPVDDALVTEFGLYFSQRHIAKMTLMPQLKREELLNLGFLLALPAELFDCLGGPAAVFHGLFFQHVRLEFAARKLQPGFQGEKVFVIPSHFMEAVQKEANLQPATARLFLSLRLIRQLPDVPVKPADLMEIEEAHHITEKIFPVYSRGGRDKYIEKITGPVMQLKPAARIKFVKAKVLDVRWLFPLDNIVALSHDAFASYQRFTWK